MAKIRSKLTGDVFEAFTQDFTNEPDFEIVDDSTPVTAEAPNVTATDGGTAAQAATDSTSGTTGGIVDTSSVTSTDPAAVGVTQTAQGGEVSADAAPVAVGQSVDGLTSASDVKYSGSADVDLGNVVASSSVSPTGSDSPTTPIESSQPDLSTAAITDPSASATPASVDSSVVAEAGKVAPVVGDGSPATCDAPAAGGDLGNVVASTDSSAAAGAAPSTVSSTSSGNSDATAALMSNQSAWSTPGTLNANGKHIVATQLESDVLFAIAQIVTPTDSIKHAADAFFAMVNSQIDVEAVA